MSQQKTSYRTESLDHSQEEPTDDTQANRALLESFTTKLLAEHPDLAHKLTSKESSSLSGATWSDPKHPDSQTVFNTFQESYPEEDELQRYEAANLIVEHLASPLKSTLENYCHDTIREDPVPYDYRHHLWSTAVDLTDRLEQASMSLEHDLSTSDQQHYPSSLEDFSKLAETLDHAKESPTGYPYIHTLLKQDPGLADQLNRYVQENVYTSDTPWFRLETDALNSIREAFTEAAKEYPDQKESLAVQVSAALTSPLWREALDNEHSDPTWSPHSKTSGLLPRIGDAGWNLNNSLFNPDPEPYNDAMKTIAALASEMDRNLQIASMRHP